MQLSIIIINFNTFTLTCKCIESVLDKVKDVDYEVILVDNASTECDPHRFSEKFPTIKLVSSPVNTGFAGGNNLGITYASGEYILLLNSDTELINNAPGICLDHIIQHPEAGMVTCHLEYPEGRTQYNCRRLRTINWELLEIIPVYRLLSKEKTESLMLHHYFDHQRFMKCDWVWGTFMLFPRKILNELPGQKLAEDFFMYCEDVLWCWQFRELGYEVHFLPRAKVMHVHKGSTNKEKLKRTTLTSIKNHAKFMKKFYPDLRWYIFAAIFYTKQYSAFWLKGILNKS